MYWNVQLQLYITYIISIKFAYYGLLLLFVVYLLCIITVLYYIVSYVNHSVWVFVKMFLTAVL